MIVATARAATIRGAVNDKSGEALIQASVRLLAQKDSSLVKGAVTNEKRTFRSRRHQGRQVHSRSVLCRLRAADAQHNRRRKGCASRAFRSKKNAIALNEAVVKGIRTPIKGDGRHRRVQCRQLQETQPNAVVEDLLKRLPGVEVGTDGKITANGKEVKKIACRRQGIFSVKTPRWHRKTCLST